MDVDIRLAQSDRQGSVAVHRIAAVHREVQEGHLQLVRIDEGLRHAGCDIEGDADAGADGAGDQFSQVAQQIPDVHGIGLKLLPAREGQHTLRERGPPCGRRLRIGEKFSGPRIVPGNVLRQQVQTGPGRHQQVVEVMRHAARELADRLQLLALSQRGLAGGKRGLARQLVRDVPSRGEDGPVLHPHVPFDASIASIRVGDPDGEVEDRRAGEDLGERFPHEIEVVRMGKVFETAADQLLPRVAQHVGPSRVHVAVMALRRNDEEEVA